MFQSRTHTCNELRLEHAGQKVKICGWMENVREVGSNFAFVVVRDFYGTTQVVIESEEMLSIVKSVNKEIGSFIRKLRAAKNGYSDLIGKLDTFAVIFEVERNTFRIACSAYSYVAVEKMVGNKYAVKSESGIEAKVILYSVSCTTACG